MWAWLPKSGHPSFHSKISTTERLWFPTHWCCLISYFRRGLTKFNKLGWRWSMTLWGLRWDILVIQRKGIIKFVEGLVQSSRFCLTYFHFPKDNCFCLILDVEQFNQFIRVHNFHMLHTAAVSERDWFTCIDLKDRYFHVPVNPHYRHFLHFAFAGPA